MVTKWFLTICTFTIAAKKCSAWKQKMSKCSQKKYKSPPVCFKATRKLDLKVESTSNFTRTKKSIQLLVKNQILHFV